MEVVKTCKCCYGKRNFFNRTCSFDKLDNINGNWFPATYDEFLNKSFMINHSIEVPTESLYRSQIAIVPIGSFREIADLSISILARLCTSFAKRFFIFIPYQATKNILYVFNIQKFYTLFGCVHSDQTIVKKLIASPGFRVADDEWHIQRQMLLLYLNFITFLAHQNKNFKDLLIIPILVPHIQSNLISCYANEFFPYLESAENLFLFLTPVPRREQETKKQFGPELLDSLINKSYISLEKAFAATKVGDESVKTLKIMLKMIELFEVDQKYRYAKLNPEENKEVLDRARYKYLTFEPELRYQPRDWEEKFVGGVYRIYLNHFQERNFKTAQEWKDLKEQELQTDNKKSGSKSPGNSKKSDKSPKKSSPNNSKGNKNPQSNALPIPPIAPKPKVIDIGVGP